MATRIFYSYPIYSSFVKKDESLLREYFRVKSFLFDQRPKKILLSFVRQFFVLLLHAYYSDAFVSFFAGYSSFLPAIFAKVFRKPHIIILGGTDCCSFPVINYGNFRKQPLKWITCKSIKLANHLVPVHSSLIRSKYSYMENVLKEQGYQVFCPNEKSKVTPVSTSYDSQKFYCTKEKSPNTFVTVAQMNPVNFYRKGIDLIFEVAPRFPSCKFTVIGSNDKMVYPSIPANLQILPFFPHEKLMDLLSTHQFYLQLSIMEGLPNALCEAMLCECVPIGSDVAGIPDGIGSTGFILKKRKIDDLEIIIREALISDFTDLGKKARERIIRLFPVDVRLKLIDIINSEIKNLQ